MFAELIKWSLQQFSHLPWRSPQRSLYTTLISEIMLQQTTVSTVIGHYERFLKAYPDIDTLAAASEEDMMVAWKGLGYYRRAKNLLAAARFIVNKHKGYIPTDYATLNTIPGIGMYTANAILAIGNNKRALALDANLERVLGRFYQLPVQTDKKMFYELFARYKLLPQMGPHLQYSPRELTEALMDLGRTLCKIKNPRCLECPLKMNCLALKNKDFSLPITNKKKKIYDLHLLRFFIFKNGKLLVYQKNEQEWLHGQWEVPTLIIKSEDKKLDQYLRAIKVKRMPKLAQYKTSITKYRITNHILSLSEKEFKRDWSSLLEGTKKRKFRFAKTDLETENLASNIKKGLSTLRPSYHNNMKLEKNREER